MIDRRARVPPVPPAEFELAWLAYAGMTGQAPWRQVVAILLETTAPPPSPRRARAAASGLRPAAPHRSGRECGG